MHSWGALRKPVKGPDGQYEEDQDHEGDDHVDCFVDPCTSVIHLAVLVRFLLGLLLLD